MGYKSVITQIDNAQPELDERLAGAIALEGVAVSLHVGAVEDLERVAHHRRRSRLRDARLGERRPGRAPERVRRDVPELRPLAGDTTRAAPRPPLSGTAAPTTTPEGQHERAALIAIVAFSSGQVA